MAGLYKEGAYGAIFEHVRQMALYDEEDAW